MKKQFLLLVGTVFTATTLFAQQVENNSFETWTNPTNPDSWGTINQLLTDNSLGNPGTATQSSDSVWQGSFSTLLEVKNASILSQSVNVGEQLTYDGAYAARPDSFLFGVDYLPVDDTATFSIVFTKAGVAVGEYPNDASNNYVSILPQTVSGILAGKINWLSSETPDSVFISFSNTFQKRQNVAAGPQTIPFPVGNVGTKLYVDAFTFFAFEEVTPTVNISVSPATVAEGGVAKFVATLSSPASVALSVNINNAGSTADTPDDFVPSKTSFDFAVGATTDTITVTTLTDAATEGDEVLTIAAAAGAGYTVGSSATLTITDVVSGIQESAAMKAIRLYPNPATTNVNVVVPADVTAQNVAITDINGKVIVAENNVSGTKVINVSNLASGNYVVTFTDATTKAFTGAKQLQVTK